jgi:hypothetical protein
MNIAAEMERPLIVPADGSPIGSMRQERWQQLERELTEVGTIEAGRTPATGVLWSRSARETATTP